jgi:hypothetical protein
MWQVLEARRESGIEDDMSLNQGIKKATAVDRPRNYNCI